MDQPRDESDIDGFHAHIYYDAASRPVAEWLRQEIEQRFQVVMGRWREAPVGPHPQTMYQVAFANDQFDRLVQWLAVNRDGLNVLVHPHTENAYNDHLVFGFWLGDKLPLNEERLIRMADRESQ